jgi:hypothetical protein
VEQELQDLRSTVEELSDEVRPYSLPKLSTFSIFRSEGELRNDLEEKIAEIDTLKSLPLDFQGSSCEACRQRRP